jgi:hypothetical protein
MKCFPVSPDTQQLLRTYSRLRDHCIQFQMMGKYAVRNTSSIIRNLAIGVRLIHSRSGFGAATMRMYCNKEWRSTNSSGSHSAIDTHSIPVLPCSSYPLNLLNSRHQNPNLFNQDPLRTPPRPAA